jgi:DNA-binding transcriptional ArsR family regulator
MVNGQMVLDRGFAALAHPVRRAIVERLARGPATVAEASRGSGISKPAITKHLRVLEDARLVERTVEGRTHRLALVAGAFDDPAGWIDRQRELWERKFDVVDDFLAEQQSQSDPETPEPKEAR